MRVPGKGGDDEEGEGGDTEGEFHQLLSWAGDFVGGYNLCVAKM
jgi:hypothetical protein